jgi:hypothetical protein
VLARHAAAGFRPFSPASAFSTKCSDNFSRLGLKFSGGIERRQGEGSEGPIERTNHRAAALTGTGLTVSLEGKGPGVGGSVRIDRKLHSRASVAHRPRNCPHECEDVPRPETEGIGKLHGGEEEVSQVNPRRPKRLRSPARFSEHGSIGNAAVDDSGDPIVALKYES